MKTNIRSVLVKVSAMSISCFKVELWQFMLKTDTDRFSIGKNGTVVTLLNILFINMIYYKATFSSNLVSHEP